MEHTSTFIIPEQDVEFAESAADAAGTKVVEKTGFRWVEAVGEEFCLRLPRDFEADADTLQHLIENDEWPSGDDITDPGVLTLADSVRRQFSEDNASLGKLRSELADADIDSLDDLDADALFDSPGMVDAFQDLGGLRGWNRIVYDGFGDGIRTYDELADAIEPSRDDASIFVISVTFE